MKIQKKYIGVAIIAAVTLIFFYLCHIFYWSSDSRIQALSYTIGENMVGQPFHSSGIFWQSVLDFYLHWGGRAAYVVLIQLFCGVLPRWTFEACNIVMWLALIFAIMRLANARLEQCVKTGFITLLSFLSIMALPLDPSFLINYLWGGTFMLWWLFMFYSVAKQRRRNPFAYLFIFLISVFIGNFQEAISAPVGASLALLLLCRRPKLSLLQYVAGTGLALGIVALIAAPGNFSRLGTLGHNSPVGLIPNLTATPEPLALTLFLIIVSLVLVIRRIRNAAGFTLLERFCRLPDTMQVLLLSIPFVCMMAVALKFAYIDRVTIFMQIVLIAYVAYRWPFHKRIPTVAMSMLLMGVAAATIWYQWNLDLFNSHKFKLIEKEYHESATGRVVIPDEMYFHEEGRNVYYLRGWEAMEKSVDPQKPDMKLLPASAARLQIVPDSVYTIQIAEQTWLLIEPLGRPGSITVHKTLLPGILDKPLAPRTIDFEEAPHTLLDTIQGSRIGYYINRRPYIRSTLETMPHSGKK